MSLEKRAERWVRAKIIDDKAKNLILEFEMKWRASALSFYLNLLGVPLVAFGVVSAFLVAYLNLGDQIGYALDLTATSTLAIGTFHVVLKKFSARNRGKKKDLKVGLLNFAFGSVLLIAAISVEG